MKKYLRVLIFLFCIKNCYSYNEAMGFDCKKSKSSVEKKICQNNYLYYLDGKMTVYFKLAKKILPPIQQIDLVHSQHKWLHLRNQCQDDICIRKKYLSRNWELFKLANPNQTKAFIEIFNLEFGDFTVNGPVSIDLLKKLDYVNINGLGQFIDGLKSDDGVHWVRNCHDSNQYSIPNSSTYDISMAAFFDLTCDILDKLKNISMPITTSIRHCSLENAIKNMPASYLPAITDHDADVLTQFDRQGFKIKNMIEKGKVELKIISEKKVMLKYYDDEDKDLAMIKNFTEIARFHAKTDKILVQESEFSSVGSYRTFNVKTLPLDCAIK